MKPHAPLTGSNRLLLGLLLFSGVTALITGMLLIAFPQGGNVMPISLLENTNVPSFRVPGLLLVSVIASLHLTAAFAMIRRTIHADWIAALSGVAMCSWVLIQIAVMNKWHWIHPLFLIVGTATFELSMAWFAREQRRFASA
jgi:hypothetical protein